jgi:hypothetical protein
MGFEGSNRWVGFVQASAEPGWTDVSTPLLESRRGHHGVDPDLERCPHARFAGHRFPTPREPAPGVSEPAAHPSVLTPSCSPNLP